MKSNLLAVFILLLCFSVGNLLTGCSSKNDSLEKKLTGKWKQTKLTIEGQLSDDLADEYEFSGDKKFVWQSYSRGALLASRTGSFKVEDDTLYLYQVEKPKEVFGAHKLAFIDDKNISLSRAKMSAEFAKQ